MLLFKTYLLHVEEYKKYYNNNKFEKRWNDEFEFPDGSYSASDAPFFINNPFLTVSPKIVYAFLKKCLAIV